MEKQYIISEYELLDLLRKVNILDHLVTSGVAEWYSSTIGSLSTINVGELTTEDLEQSYDIYKEFDKQPKGN